MLFICYDTPEALHSIVVIVSKVSTINTVDIPRTLLALLGTSGFALGLSGFEVELSEFESP